MIITQRDLLRIKYDTVCTEIYGPYMMEIFLSFIKFWESHGVNAVHKIEVVMMQTGIVGISDKRNEKYSPINNNKQI